jgi:hypothetical protein
MSGRDDDRPRKSWREIDQARDGTGPRRSEERRPRGAAAEARSRPAPPSDLKQLDRHFSKGQGEGGGDAGRLADALRAAQGGPALAEACAQYRDGAGWPRDPALASIFLDSGVRELVVGCLEALAEANTEEPLQLPAGLKSQLRLLAEDSDDAIAGAAEDLLAD